MAPHSPTTDRRLATADRASVQIKSYAKINWTLDVLFKREDGFHELRTIYQTVSLHDRLRISATPNAIEITCDDSRVPTDETNLAHRATTALRQATGVTAGARIEIEKRIPVAAGLGGGSSNAAAALLGLARLWEVEVADREMVELAMSLGSDVPFFLVGGTALGVGRGEEVYPIEQADCEHLLLVNPGFAVPTATAYARLSRLTRSRSPRIIPFTLFAAKAALPLAASNDLELVVSAAHPEIAELKRRLLGLGARHALMSGSGATVFGVFDNSGASERARSEMRGAGYWAECARAVCRQEYRDTIFG
ncbi:MAG TPA: 4-(cytidine 5'-diphospho)-2-C-methyl-D-erythritol kinase [Blastocatellia bacterium]|jgi:4-diphosphocytidyl-2-C-methyl-D-erythritol kinase|nr:4-(cytidine 5'-diphospho)-2-C-methyl-D-erythritol kinase [Blastocatellia bacterium]